MAALNAFWVLFGTVFITLSILGTAGFGQVQNVIVERNVEAAVARFADIFSTHDSSLLSQIVTEDVTFDITESGGPGPQIGLAQLTGLFDLLAMIIRSQTTVMSNFRHQGAGIVLVNLQGVQAMDQILNVNDTLLPSIVTGGVAEIHILGGRVSYFKLLPPATQVMISQTLSGVLVPTAKKRKRIRETPDLVLWQLMQAYIASANAQGKPQLAHMLENTPAYHHLAEQFLTASAGKRK